VIVFRDQDSRDVINAMSVDVEDYFQVSAFDEAISRDRWDSFESRVRANTERVLATLEPTRTRATFFVLGWVAERHPALIRQIADRGHEIASHGYDHRLVFDLTPDEFRADLRRARAAIESAAGVTVRGYRAPSFSITERSLWALDILIEEGYAYDASIFPIRHDRYGMPSAPRHIHTITRRAGSLWEVPGSTTRVSGMILPIAGGGYFRLLPYGWTRRGIARVNLRERQPVVFYIHPWELDPEQPRLPASQLTRLRHYRNLSETVPRLERLLSEFRFDSIGSILDGRSTGTDGTLQ
jgi:polysaccharide deacetylase family protein (PEP-CTERM system associated)